MQKRAFLIGGRSFQYVEETSVEHDEYMEARLRPAGLHEVTMQIGEDAESFARRLVLQSAEHGVRRELLAALIMPADADEWTPAMAAETAAFLGKLKEEEDKEKLRLLFTSMLFRFFELGISSLYAYVRSLDEAAEKATEKGADPALERTMGVLEGRATSRVDVGDDGQSSSAPLPISTMTLPGE